MSSGFVKVFLGFFKFFLGLGQQRDACLLRRGVYISRLVASVHSQLLAFAAVVPSPHERLSGRGVALAPVDSLGVGGAAGSQLLGGGLGWRAQG